MKDVVDPKEVKHVLRSRTSPYSVLLIHALGELAVGEAITSEKLAEKAKIPSVRANTAGYGYLYTARKYWAFHDTDPRWFAVLRNLPDFHGIVRLNTIEEVRSYKRKAKNLYSQSYNAAKRASRVKTEGLPEDVKLDWNSAMILFQTTALVLKPSNVKKIEEEYKSLLTIKDYISETYKMFQVK